MEGSGVGTGEDGGELGREGNVGEGRAGRKRRREWKRGRRKAWVGGRRGGKNWDEEVKKCLYSHSPIRGWEGDDRNGRVRNDGSWGVRFKIFIEISKGNTNNSMKEIKIKCIVLY